MAPLSKSLAGLNWGFPIFLVVLCCAVLNRSCSIKRKMNVACWHSCRWKSERCSKQNDVRSVLYGSSTFIFSLAVSVSSTLLVVDDWFQRKKITMTMVPPGCLTERHVSSQKNSYVILHSQEVLVKHKKRALSRQNSPECGGKTNTYVVMWCDVRSDLDWLLRLDFWCTSHILASLLRLTDWPVRVVCARKAR